MKITNKDVDFTEDCTLADLLDSTSHALVLTVNWKKQEGFFERWSIRPHKWLQQEHDGELTRFVFPVVPGPTAKSLLDVIQQVHGWEPEKSGEIVCYLNAIQDEIKMLDADIWLEKNNTYEVTAVTTDKKLEELRFAVFTDAYDQNYTYLVGIRQALKDLRKLAQLKV